MMSGMPLETCSAFNKRCNNKFYYKAAPCWLFLLIALHLYSIWQMMPINFVYYKTILRHIPSRHRQSVHSCISGHEHYSTQKRATIARFQYLNNSNFYTIHTTLHPSAYQANMWDEMPMNQLITFVPTQANSKKTAILQHHSTRGKKNRAAILYPEGKCNIS